MSKISNNSEELLALAAKVFSPNYRQPPIILRGGKGARLWDKEGRSYLDLTSGIGVSALGHSSPVVQEAIGEAQAGLIHTSNLFFTEPAVRLAELLVQRSFADRVFFCNSGTEANEAAIKYARLCGGEARREIVYFSGSFHGRTLGSLAATAKPAYQQPFQPLPAGFVQAEWNSPAAFASINSQTAAVIVEPIQGEGGINLPHREWLQGLRERCHEVGALLVFDEVQAGVGRTGKLWAHEHFGVTPDILTLAKPLAGGLPIGAVLMTEKVSSCIYPGCHGTTFGGGPFVTHIARKVFETVSAPDFLADVERKGQLLGNALREISSPIIRHVRGIGLMWGIELEKAAIEVVAAARDRGLFVCAAGERVVRILPPLTITDAELHEAVALLEQALNA